MKTAKVSDYRSHLSSYHKSIIKDHNPLLISGNEGNVVILPEDDYENIIETIYVLRDKTTMFALEETRLKMSKGTYSGSDMNEEFSDVLES